MKKVRELIFLLILIGVFIVINYSSLDGFVIKNFSSKEYVQIERVIDGDTVVVNGTSIRMLGINTPERGEKYYAEAKNYTESLVLNKTIVIERRGKDLYDRDLAYLFYNDENLNSKIIEKGYANAYFPEGKDSYYFIFIEAWEKCIENNQNLCKKSSDKCADCINVKRFSSEEDLILYNSCDFACNITGWNIKDEGRKKFVFQKFTLLSGKDVKITSEDFNKTYVWTNTGDTMFLRDSKGELVLWEGY